MRGAPTNHASGQSRPLALAGAIPVTFPSWRNQCSWGVSATTTCSTRNTFGVGFRVSHLGTPTPSPQTSPISWRELVVRDNNDKPHFGPSGGPENGVPDAFVLHFNEPSAARCRGLSAIYQQREGGWSVDVESIWAAVLRRATFPEAPVRSENEFRLKPQVFP
jgi:hypothetical protein